MQIIPRKMRGDHNSFVLASLYRPGLDDRILSVLTPEFNVKAMHLPCFVAKSSNEK